MTRKSERPSQIVDIMESILLNMTNTVRWRDRWWLVDAETSGLRHQEHEIIAIWLACMEDFKITQEQEILVRPQRPLTTKAELLTGISNQALEQAGPLDAAIDRLAELDGPLILIHGKFELPFLQDAYARCGRVFSAPCLLLEYLAALLLNCSPWKKAKNYLEKLPPPAGWDEQSLRNRFLKEYYGLALALFDRLERDYQIENTVQLTDYVQQEAHL